MESRQSLIYLFVLQYHGSCRVRATRSATLLLRAARWSAQDISGLSKMPRAFLTLAFCACLTASVTCLAESMPVKPHTSLGSTTALRKLILIAAVIPRQVAVLR